jgi:hypothetical protein
VVTPLLATNPAFFVIFGAFVVALLALVVIVIRWAVRHDRAGWKIWRNEQAAARAQRFPTVEPPPPRPRTEDR